MDQPNLKEVVQTNEALPLPAALLEKMAATLQNPRYHAEGNVLNHTRLVLKAYRDNHHQFKLDSSDHEVLYWASILHDVGKPATTRWQDNRWRAKGHEAAGVPIARDILLGQPQISSDQRKRILDLVRYHAVPLQWGLNPNSLQYYYQLATRADLRMIGIFGYFDLVGRICQDREEVLNIAHRFNQEMVAKIEYELGTYTEIQTAYRQASLRHQNALWTSLYQKDISLLTKLIQAESTRSEKPQFRCVIPVGVDSPRLRSYLEQQYTDAETYDASRLNPERQGKFDLETQLRPLKHFLSVYGRPHKTLVLTGMPIDQDLLTTITNFGRQKGGRIEHLFIEEPLDSIAQSGDEASQRDIKAAHKKLMLPHPWSAHELKLMSL